jgi:NitT/TauT family transport system permease protein
MGASRAADAAPRGDPAAAPFIFAGLRIAVPMALIVVVITEMVSSADGLGYLVIYSLSSLRTDRMLAVVVVIARSAGLLDQALVLARDRLYTGKSSKPITSERDAVKLRFFPR